MNSVGQVRTAIAAYDAALRTHDLDAVDAWFWPAPSTSRFGVDGVAYGADGVSAARRDPSSATTAPIDRVEGRHELFALGDDVVVATLEHWRTGDPTRRRRTQVWCRTDAGDWRIAHAHLSVEHRSP